MKFYSDVTKVLYNTVEECEAAEAAHLKAEEEKKNGYNIALQELDTLLAQFEEEQKANENAYKKAAATSKLLQTKYVEFQRKHGRLPDKHYMNYILTRMF
jgi:hypothetical protein